MSNSNKLRMVLRAALFSVFVPFAAFAYTVTYNCGDGTGTPPASATVSDDENFTPVMTLKNSCARSGYILSGWLVSGTGDIQTGTFTWEYTADKTLTAQWVQFTPKFTVTTTNMSAGDIFKYWQGADGLFYVDWGDGTLQTINYKDVITHTYETAGVHTIRFDGLATDYNLATGDDVPGVISFGNRAVQDSGITTHAGTPLFVSKISGSLGAIYPTISGIKHPRFTATFDGCVNLNGFVPASMFSGVTGGGADTFYSTFNDTSMDTTCPCGAHDATTAWGISSVDGRAVCEDGPKSNEHYYNNECVTDCSFATNLKTETGASYPLLSEQVTAHAIVVQNGDMKCYVPLESGAGDFNLKWGNNLYHAGDLDVVN